MLFVLLFTFTIIFFIEYKKYKTFISPASLSILSYTIAIVVALIGEKIFNYKAISDNVYFIILLSIIVTWIPSFMFHARNPQNYKIIDIQFVKRKVSFSNQIIFFSLIVLSTIGLFFSLKNGKPGSEQFELQYSHGIFAHIRNLFSVIITYLLCFKPKTKKIIFVTIFCLSCVFLSGTKYHLYFIFFPILIMYLKRPTLKKMITLLIISVAICVFIFASNYLIGFLLRGSKIENFGSFVFNHLCKYIGGGLIGFSEYLNGAKSFSRGFYWIDTVHIESSNVYTLIGGFFFKYGWCSLLNMFIIGVFGYLIFWTMLQTVTKNKKEIIFLFYCYLIGIPMLLSFFASYYGLSNIWEFAFFSLLIYIILQERILNPILQYKIER